jgi:prepilin-type N-terminal cleavage/methylation domain-containing protein
MNNRGFSLIELIIVIAIMGTLMTIATLNFNAWQRKVQIERQTRELFADINQARIDSLHSKLRHSIVMQPKSYTFRRYSSENESSNAGTIMFTRNVSFEITRADGTSAENFITEFDIRGYYNVIDTILGFDPFRINPVGTAAQVDCIIIGTGRTNLGKTENDTCVIK